MPSGPGYSIADQAAKTRGHPSGFDYMRLLLAVSIVMLHSCITSYGVQSDVALATGYARPLLRVILPMFFALSGFLVAGSLERSRTLGVFLALRAIRIYPALMVEVVLSALLLGPLVTDLPLGRYFSDPRLHAYLLNAFGIVHFVLPGVFDNNPLPHTVNGQLWTIPFELYCYLTLAFLVLVGLKRRRAIGPISVAVVTLAYLGVTLYRHHGEVVFVTGAINGALLVATFLAGVSLYLYRETVPWNRKIGLTSVVAMVLLLGYIPYGDFLAPAPAAYATVYLGLMNPNRGFLRGADYSYGIYLYGFAVQQTLMDLWPASRVWYLNILLCLPCVVLIAAFSWHFVERPASKLRRVAQRSEDWWLAFRPGRRRVV